MSDHDSTRVEPFRIKSVEPIQLISRDEREAALERAGYNVFRLSAQDVFIDLMTDSGTSAMSSRQWAALMLGDESYAGSTSFGRFEAAAQEVLGFPHVLPTHQGRPAEDFLFRTLVKPGQVVPFNIAFDSTAAHVEVQGASAVACVADAAFRAGAEGPFKGDIDLTKLSNVIEREGKDRVPLVMVTITNNAGGGQPVSMACLRGVKQVADRYDIPVFIDAARCAENAYFIQQREPGFADRSVREIMREQFSHAQGCTFSCKKDALVNIGGLIATRDRSLYERLVPLLVLHEGYITYGGMAGRDLEALAVGLHEMCDDRYLAHRVAQVKQLGDDLTAAGIPIVRPTGGHAVCIDAAAFFPHLTPAEFPADALAIELYREAGIRAVGLGALAFMKEDPETGQRTYPKLELLRLAVPRRVYTASHLGFVARALAKVHARRKSVRGMRIVSAPPVLRHFTAVMAPLDHASRGPDQIAPNEVSRPFAGE